MINTIRFIRVLSWLFHPIAIWTWWIIRFCFALVVTAMASLWVGVPTATQNLAREWLLRAAAMGLPEGFLRFLRPFFIVAAILGILAGWIILAHLTVWLWLLIWT